MEEELPKRIAVLGAGVMGEALISALTSSGVEPASISITEKREDRAAYLVEKYGVQNLELLKNVRACQAILLVVKPQDMLDLLIAIGPELSPGALLISFAAGKRIEFIAEQIGGANPIVRVMPNTPALIGEGMAAISLGPNVSSSQRSFVLDFLAATGRVVEVDENLQDAVTAVSGSGPAYFFAFVEAMISAGEEMGLSSEVATELTVQTFVGAAQLLAKSGMSAKALRENVTSPKGTTAAALQSLADADLPKIVSQAMHAARDRSQELA